MDRRSPDRPRLDAVLVALVLVAAGLRLYGIGAQSLWYDEWLTTEAVAGGLGDLIRHVANREGITPTYFILTWGWVRVFGDGDVALRLLPTLAGIATVPVAYYTALAFDLRRRVARVAALLVAVNPLLVWYSQEARPYSLLALAAGLSLLTFARARPPHARQLVWWALAAAATVALHYFGAFVVGAEAVLLLVAWRPRWQPVVLAAVPAGVVGLALVPFAVEQHSHASNRDWIAGFALSARVQDAGRTALVGPSPPLRDLWIVPAVGGRRRGRPARGPHRRAGPPGRGGRGGGRRRRGGGAAGGVAGGHGRVPRPLRHRALVPLVVAVAVGLGASRPAAAASRPPACSPSCRWARWWPWPGTRACSDPTGGRSPPPSTTAAATSRPWCSWT